MPPPTVGEPRPLDIDTDVLDCVQANLTAVANDLHGDRRETRLGASLLFPRPGRDGAPLPSIELSLDEQLANASPPLGLRHGEPRTHDGGRAVVEGLTGDWTLVLADAFEMPWVPYHGQRHTGHTFALRRRGDDVELLDAYTNETPWGSATPGVWSIPSGELAGLLPAGETTSVALGAGDDGGADGADRVRPRSADVDDLRAAITAYGEAFAAHDDLADALDHLTVETWLLARCRAAHARWLATGDGSPARQRADEHAAQWAEQAEATYMAMRRASRGREIGHDVVARVVELLLDDLALLDGADSADSAAGGTADPGAASGVVTAAAARVLGVDAAELRRDPDLTRFPTYTSFRVLDIVESVEQELAVEVDPADLVPEKLRHLDTVCAMFTGGRR